jgi:hypothetical protein
MKPKAIMVRKKPRTGLGNKPRSKNGVVYIEKGNIGKRVVVMSVPEWCEIKRQIATAKKIKNAIRRIYR